MKTTDLNPEDTIKVPASSVRFRTTAELRIRGAERYCWPDNDLIITGASGGHHVRAYQLVASGEGIGEDDFWVEIPLSEALQRIARSFCFEEDKRHHVVRTYIRGWKIMHEFLDHPDALEREA